MKKEKLILKKFKLDNKLKIKKILFNFMIFIIDKKIKIIQFMILLLLKWNQQIQIQKQLFKNKYKK